MNKGFLMFSQDEGLTTTMLKDEPEDLTHLAPTAGDACIPLEDNHFDMFDELLLNDNYCLLGDDLTNGSPVDSLTPDSLLLSSPEPQEHDSSCEQPSLFNELSLDAFDSNRSDNDIDDGNSPFIPTSDELPVVMWGALPDNVSLARPQPTEAQASSPAPALQRLLTAPTTGPRPQDLITNIYSDQGLLPSKSISSWDTGMKRVMKQEQEPSAKRAKRSPSPAQQPTSTKSSSVLMNLLDLPQQCPQLQHPQQNGQLHPNYQLVRNIQLDQHIPIPVLNMSQQIPKQIHRSNTPLNQMQMRATMNSPLSNPMSPLSLNINSPMYSLPSSPNSYNNSPAMSPAQRERVMSPYSGQTLSPVGKYQQYSPGNRLVSPAGVMKGCDPYLTTKMQPSPGFPLQTPEIVLDVPLTASDFWADSEMLQGTNDLLTAFDDVKLV